MLAGSHKLENFPLNLDLVIKMRKDTYKVKATHKVCEEGETSNHYYDHHPVHTIEFSFYHGMDEFWSYATKEERDESFESIVRHGMDR